MSLQLKKQIIDGLSKLEHQPMDNNYMKKSQRKSNLYNRRTARLTKRCIWVCIDM